MIDVNQAIIWTKYPKIWSDIEKIDENIKRFAQEGATECTVSVFKYYNTNVFYILQYYSNHGFHAVAKDSSIDGYSNITISWIV